MGDKKDTKALAGLMEKYSGWKMIDCWHRTTYLLEGTLLA
jgi:hypothetical protein